MPSPTGRRHNDGGGVRGGLRADCVEMLAAAVRHGLDVPDDLRERLSLGVRGLTATRRLHGELAAIVRPALSASRSSCFFFRSAARCARMVAAGLAVVEVGVAVVACEAGLAALPHPASSAATATTRGQR
ncbi:MAG: hypothetical protein ACLQMH_13500 [Solirubrobacteraceae bacterium]